MKHQRDRVSTRLNRLSNAFLQRRVAFVILDALHALQRQRLLVLGGLVGTQRLLVSALSGHELVVARTADCLVHLLAADNFPLNALHSRCKWIGVTYLVGLHSAICERREVTAGTADGIDLVDLLRHRKELGNARERLPLEVTIERRDDHRLAAVGQFFAALHDVAELKVCGQTTGI